MIDTRSRLTLDSARKAVQVRRALGVADQVAISPFDAAEQLGVEVWFVNIPSMEGTYVKTGRPHVLLSALRPAGRQAYNCAHEIGHHVFGHGTRIDQYLEAGSADVGFDATEFLADAFAASFLMPSSAVRTAFRVRGWVPAVATPLQIFTISQWLGVGYTALITHMQITLQLLSSTKAQALSKMALKGIRRQLFDRDLDGDVIPVAQHWLGRPVDVALGDVLVVPDDITAEGPCLLSIGQAGAGSCYKAVCVGTGRLAAPDGTWASYVRVSRPGYVGRNAYRFLEDDDE